MLLPFVAVLGEHAYWAAMPSGAIPFEATRWDKARAEGWSQAPRYRMAKGLVERGDLIGMHVDEVRALLDTKTQQGGLLKERYLMYTVREQEYFAEALVQINLDDEGRVESVFGPYESPP